MRLVINILTPPTAFCLFGTAYDWPVQEKRPGQTIVKKATHTGRSCMALLARSHRESGDANGISVN